VSSCGSMRKKAAAASPCNALSPPSRNNFDDKPTGIQPRSAARQRPVTQIPQRTLPVRDAAFGATSRTGPHDGSVGDEAGVDAALLAFEASRRCRRLSGEVRRVGYHVSVELRHRPRRAFARADRAGRVQEVSKSVMYIAIRSLSVNTWGRQPNGRRSSDATATRAAWRCETSSLARADRALRPPQGEPDRPMIRCLNSSPGAHATAATLISMRYATFFSPRSHIGCWFVRSPGLFAAGRHG